MSRDAQRPDDLVNGPPSSQPPTPPSPPDWDAIARYLAGESSVDEAARIEQWLAANPADRELISQLDTAATIEPPTDVDIEGALSRVHRRMAGARPATSAPAVLPFAPRRHPRLFVAAAMGLVAASVVAVVAIVHRTPGGSSARVAARTYSTPVGKRDSVTLADGSRVVLGPDSHLTVASDFGTRSREVELRGDAYFDVQHNATRPFAVRVASAVIEDLGTTFTVESDDGDTTRVAVLSGTVRLRASNGTPTSGVVLDAGDRGAIDLGGHASVMRHAVRSEDTAWTTGQVVFRDASLARVAGEIRRWYGVQIRVTDSSLLNTHLNTSFNGEPVDQVLKRIGLMLGAHIERQADTAVVSPIRGPSVAR
jgi:transmembrane sensor